MSVLVVGSVAFDSIETPFGARREIVGGAATYFSLAASCFTKVSIVAAVGEDFRDDHLALLNRRDIDLSGIERCKGETFRWAGRYHFDLNTRDTLETRLGVFADFKPKVPERLRKPGSLFLANIDPDLQYDVLSQVSRPALVGCDTMNYWIEGKPESLRKTLSKVDVLVINDGEVRQLASEPNLVRAAAAVRGMGPSTLIVKRGEFGAAAFGNGGIFAVPALLLDTVVDPTGAGDSFAGGFMGYLAKHAERGPVDDGMMRRAIAMGCVMASFAVQSFGVEGLLDLDHTRIQKRYEEFRALSHIGE